MERSRGRETTKAYRARLRGGPADGTDLAVAAEPDGEPPESIDAAPDDSGMYLLAGLPNPDGSTPYWWIAADTGALRPADPAEATWTLVSIGDDGSTAMWHQHGEDAEPVPLAVEPVATDELPTHIGRAYSCPSCSDTAVISRPVQPTTSERSMSIEASRHIN